MNYFCKDSSCNTDLAHFAFNGSHYIELPINLTCSKGMPLASLG